MTERNYVQAIRDFFKHDLYYDYCETGENHINTEVIIACGDVEEELFEAVSTVHPQYAETLSEMKERNLPKEIKEELNILFDDFTKLVDSGIRPIDASEIVCTKYLKEKNVSN